MDKKEYSHDYYLRNKEYYRAYYQRNKERQRQYRLAHKAEYIEYSRRNREKNKDHRRAQEMFRRRRVRIEVLTHYGNGLLACVHCRFSDERALSIDHINNDGALHRRTVGSGSSMYQWLAHNNLPKGFQTLCANCQMIKEIIRRHGTSK